MTKELKMCKNAAGIVQKMDSRMSAEFMLFFLLGNESGQGGQLKEQNKEKNNKVIKQNEVRYLCNK